MNKILGIALLVVLVVAGFAIWLHGNAQLSAGKTIGEKSCQASQATAAAEGVTESSEQLKKAMNHAETIPTDNLDRIGIDLGILRRDEDY